ncbi:hypothetical protein ABLE92_13180 [Gordonia sp. VNQ95]|jgi:hypothetical protein
MTRGTAVPAESRGGVFGVDPTATARDRVRPEMRDHCATYFDNSFSGM